MAGVIRKSLIGNTFSYISNSFLSGKCIRITQVAGLVSKNMRDKDYKRPPAFNYKENIYGLSASLFDRTTFRFDENSKIIVVDGPFASGKKKLAKELAEEFDLLYIPPAHLDSYYVNSYGYDFRTLNDKVPPGMQSYDVEDFLTNPKDKRRSTMQNLFFIIRFNQYMDALNHVLNTGQGVVMHRCVYSIYVFLDTYIKHGFLPPDLKTYINLVWNALKPDLMQPHLIIYLDTPVDVIRKNLEERNNPIELNSPVMTPEVLKDFEYNYKFKYLQEMSAHAELLIYDNTEKIETEIVVEDIERVNLDDYDEHDPKMKDWRLVDETTWCQRRISYSKYREVEYENFLETISGHYCDELMFGAEESLEYELVWDTLPGNRYAEGFNEDLGDSVLLK